MSSLYSHKEDEVLQTPLLLFDVTLPDGTHFFWSTHEVTYGTVHYDARVLSHGAFHLHLDTDVVYTSSATLTLQIGNADGSLNSRLDPKMWRGASIKVRFLFYDLQNSQAGEDSKILFLGSCQCIDEITDTTINLSFNNKFGVRRTYVPSTPLQARCPWEFPNSLTQRTLSLTGGTIGQYSPLYRCGYSPDVPGGCGDLTSGAPYTSCAYTRSDCQARGMLDHDQRGNVTRRFAGVDVSTIDSEAGSRNSIGSRVVPLVYGTGWVKAVVVRSVVEQGYIRAYAALSHGPINGVLRVTVNDYELPKKEPGRNMEASGWYTLISAGDRSGSVDPEADDALPVGPLGSIAYVRISIPSAPFSSTPVINIEALVEGLYLPRYDPDGNPLGMAFSSNPVWIYLDLLRRAGWGMSDLDLASFGRIAAKCDLLSNVPSSDGRIISITKRRCNLILQEPKSITDLMREISLASGLYSRYTAEGRLGVDMEGPLASQHPTPPLGTNCRGELNGGYPAYEFGDGTDGFGGIARRTNGQPAFRRWSNPTPETANKAWTEYVDEFNSYARSTVAVSEVDDILATGQELAVSLKTAGLTNYAHAMVAARVFLKKSVNGNVFIEFESSVRAVNVHPGDLITVTYPKFGFSRALFRVLRMTLGLNGGTIKLLGQLHADEWYDENSLLIQTHPTGVDANSCLPRPILGTIERNDGTDFGIDEQAVSLADGTSGTAILAQFLHPNSGAQSLSPPPTFEIEGCFVAGGNLQAGNTYVYGIAGIDLMGRFTSLSDIARISLPADGSRNSVRFWNVSGDPSIGSFTVYRGTDASRLRLIQSIVSPASGFLDVGYEQQEQVPPDSIYDHANFYWREEIVGSTQASISSASSIGNTTLALPPNGMAGRVIRVIEGNGFGQERIVLSNSSTVLQIASPWANVPDSSSRFCVADTNWRFGCSSNTSPARFEVTNRRGMGIHITGRSANAANVESPAGLAPTTRHTLLGASGSGVDTAPPPEPFYGLTPAGQGTISLVGLSFPSLENTRTVTSAQLTLHYWDELQGPSTTTLSCAAGVGTSTLLFSSLDTLSAGSLVQIGRELVRLESRVGNGNEFEVTRSVFDTEASAYVPGQQCFVLRSRPIVVPLQPSMFGTSLGGAFVHSTFFPDVRVVAASLFAQNRLGSSPVCTQVFTETSNLGIRTLSGGQYSIQYPGFLAIQANIAPPLVVESSHAVGDIFATVTEAPTGGPVEIAVRMGGAVFCSLTIAAGSTSSNIVDGSLLPYLPSGATLAVDLTSIPSGFSDSPGKDLTVTIRL